MGVFVATESGSLTLSDGSTIDIHKDVTRVREGHLALKEHAIFFKSADEDVDYEYEKATKAPGEKRTAPVKADKG
jgi:hypothetical protein